MLADPSIWNAIRYDGREPVAINHPAVTYYLAEDDGVVSGMFIAVRFSPWEVEVHAAVLPHALHQSRELGRQFLAIVFSDPQVQRATAYVIGRLRTAANYCRKLGFVDEGRRHDACMIDGKPEDIVVLGLRRIKWQLQRSLDCSNQAIAA